MNEVAKARQTVLNSLHHYVDAMYPGDHPVTIRRNRRDMNANIEEVDALIAAVREEALEYGFRAGRSNRSWETTVAEFRKPAKPDPKWQPVIWDLGELAGCVACSWLDGKVYRVDPRCPIHAKKEASDG